MDNYGEGTLRKEKGPQWVLKEGNVYTAWASMSQKNSPADPSQPSALVSLAEKQEIYWCPKAKANLFPFKKGCHLKGKQGKDKSTR